MRPVAIEIEGEFYDSFLTGDRLILFRPEGIVSSHSWKDLVGRLHIQNDDPLLPKLLLGIQENRASTDALLLSDQAIRIAIKDRLNQVAEQPLIITAGDLEATLLRRQHIPFEFPFSSFEISNGVAYVAGSLGVFELSARPSLVGVFSSRNHHQRSSVACTQLRLGWDTMLACCGQDGLLELGGAGEEFKKDPQIAGGWINSCGWVGVSIYASSPNPGESQLIVYSYPNREYVEVIGEQDIFGDVQASWGERNRICGIRDKVLFTRETRFVSFHDGPILEDVTNIDLPMTGKFISGSNSLFGTVIETDAELIVVDSESNVDALPGSVVNWRVYPRSARYGGFMSVAFEGKMVQFVFPDTLLPKPPVDMGKSLQQTERRRIRPAA